MTIAELHGKLNPDRPNGAHERMEDLLTSDVFGTMKYVGWQHGFINWLRSAQSPDGKYFAEDVLPVDDIIKCARFMFWPLLKNNREPDVLIGFETERGEIFQLMIEAKYFSGASDIEMDIERKMPDRSGNQIADQVNCFPDYFPDIQNKVIKNIHIYVTADDSCPLQTYERAVNHILKKEISLFWLNWQSLLAFLKNTQIEDKGRQEMINDLINLLQRKNLVPFDGFKINLIGEWSTLIGQSFWQAQPWWDVPLPHSLSPKGFLKEVS